jgi:hypothetical protein
VILKRTARPNVGTPAQAAAAINVDDKETSETSKLMPHKPNAAVRITGAMDPDHLVA